MILLYKQSTFIPCHLHDEVSRVHPPGLLGVLVALPVPVEGFGQGDEFQRPLDDLRLYLLGLLLGLLRLRAARSLGAARALDIRNLSGGGESSRILTESPMTLY